MANFKAGELVVYQGNGEANGYSDHWDIGQTYRVLNDSNGNTVYVESKQGRQLMWANYFTSKRTEIKRNLPGWF